MSINKQNKKIALLTSDELKVYKTSGTLSRKNQGFRGPMYVYYLNGNIVPGDTFPKNDPSGIQNYLGKDITVEYIPEILKIRSYTNSEGRGYNFITKTNI